VGSLRSAGMAAQGCCKAFAHDLLRSSPVGGNSARLLAHYFHDEAFALFVLLVLLVTLLATRHSTRSRRVAIVIGVLIVSTRFFVDSDPNIVFPYNTRKNGWKGANTASYTELLKAALWCCVANMASVTWLLIFGLAKLAVIPRTPSFLSRAGMLPLLPYLMHPILLPWLISLGQHAADQVRSSGGMVLGTVTAAGLIVCHSLLWMVVVPYCVHLLVLARSWLAGKLCARRGGGVTLHTGAQLHAKPHSTGVFEPKELIGIKLTTCALWFLHLPWRGRSPGFPCAFAGLVIAGAAVPGLMASSWGLPSDLRQDLSVLRQLVAQQRSIPNDRHGWTPLDGPWVNVSSLQYARLRFLAEDCGWDQSAPLPLSSASRTDALQTTPRSSRGGGVRGSSGASRVGRSRTEQKGGTQGPKKNTKAPIGASRRDIVVEQLSKGARCNIVKRTSKRRTCGSTDWGCNPHNFSIWVRRGCGGLFECKGRRIKCISPSTKSGLPTNCSCG